MSVSVFVQERRREFEANLRKAGLELETEDKSVSYPSVARWCSLVVIMQQHITLLQGGEYLSRAFLKGNFTPQSSFLSGRRVFNIY